MLANEKRQFIEFMIGAGVLKFGEFITKSGRKSPYFVNTGNYNTGAQLYELGKHYAALVKSVCGNGFDAMFGPAYKGIALVASTAVALYDEYKIDKPYFFNRKEVKDHGEGGSIVGYTPQNGDNIIIIEDVITAGTALRESLAILTGVADVKIKDMFISVNRCEVGKDDTRTVIHEVNDEFGINVHSIVDVTDICAYLSETGGHDGDLTRMKEYMDKYCII